MPHRQRSRLGWFALGAATIIGGAALMTRCACDALRPPNLAWAVPPSEPTRGAWDTPPTLGPPAVMSHDGDGRVPVSGAFRWMYHNDTGTWEVVSGSRVESFLSELSLHRGSMSVGSAGRYVPDAWSEPMDAPRSPRRRFRWVAGATRHWSGTPDPPAVPAPTEPVVPK